MHCLTHSHCNYVAHKGESILYILAPPSFHRVNYVKRGSVVAHNHSNQTRRASIAIIVRRRLDELLESAVEGRAEGLDFLVEVDGELGALGNALGGELELL